MPAEERWILDQTLKTDHLNYFTNFYFRLPNSGTMWMPDDSLGKYRNVLQYPQLHEMWSQFGKPETFSITADGNPFNFRLIWAPGRSDPTFLFPHGFIMLDWLLPIIDLNTQVALAITGTGTGKTSGVSIAAPAYGALKRGGKKQLAHRTCCAQSHSRQGAIASPLHSGPDTILFLSWM